MVVQDNEHWSQAEREKGVGRREPKKNQRTAEMNIENKNYCHLHC